MSKTTSEKVMYVCQSITCDRCGHVAQRDGEGFENFVNLDFESGWSSAFGDGQHVEADLCHACVKDLLGPWLRVSDSRWAGGPARLPLLGVPHAIASFGWAALSGARISVSESDVAACGQPKHPNEGMP